MLLDFTYYNPTKIHFGKNSLEKLGDGGGEVPVLSGDELPAGAYFRPGAEQKSQGGSVQKGQHIRGKALKAVPFRKIQPRRGGFGGAESDGGVGHMLLQRRFPAHRRRHL